MTINFNILKSIKTNILKFMNQRTIIGLSISAGVLLCLYYNLINILLWTMNVALIYDCCYSAYKLNMGYLKTGILFLVIIFFHYKLIDFYFVDPIASIMIVTISQVSDVYQYLLGTQLGKNKIGWISQNKTYEGYIFGWILTLCTFAPVIYFLQYWKHAQFMEDLNVKNSIIVVTIDYLLGVLGGLVSSLFKRLSGVKDYSNLLGPHGGWIDRIDSIIFPALFHIFLGL